MNPVNKDWLLSFVVVIGLCMFVYIIAFEAGYKEASKAKVIKSDGATLIDVCTDAFKEGVK